MKGGKTETIFMRRYWQAVVRHQHVEIRYFWGAVFGTLIWAGFRIGGPILWQIVVIF